MTESFSDKLFALSAFSPAERRFACQQDFLLFFAYYFNDYVRYPFAPFHHEMAQDIMDLDALRIRECAWVMARDTAKTSLAKGYAVWTVAYGKAKYMNVDCYERSNSERILFDIVNVLQTNQKLRADFGELFNQVRNPAEKLAKKISDFVTTNGIRTEAHTTQESIRGRLHQSFRPDWVWIDDYETLNTARSEAATQQVREHFAELKGGIDQKTGKILYTSNWLTEDGTVADICKRAAIDKSLRVRRTFLLDEVGRPSWPSRHVLTDAELTLPENMDKVSIESLRRAMRSADSGDVDFEREYLGNVIDPMGDGPDKQGYMPLFKQDSVKITSRAFLRNGPFVIGVDPAGEGSDSTSIVIRSAFQAQVYATEKTSTGKSIALLVVQAMKEFTVPAQQVVIDAFGVGFKAVKELSLLGLNIKAVNVGEKEVSKDMDGYLNDRAYGYFQLRDWLAQGGELCDHQSWKEQLRCIRHQTDGKNRRHIIPKKEIIKRGFRSPDCLDALMLSMLAELRPRRPMRSNRSSDDFDKFAVI